eukprot:CAMPEP_0206178852 /NCGR_PEP_ID=MMETSP1474-20131121/65583_1 /ASSEMBLY_ACC=CAM_ASM_001110 /TAXON_ID=97495 /ORGANISM="Imantonia sp., Strain RCC918" /LENGTH=94 /DNA_ID=CAMNT_0053591663 /DNA_START=61 /DNA_END=343 /DNA_ORIENTATION=-
MTPTGLFSRSGSGVFERAVEHALSSPRSSTDLQPRHELVDLIEYTRSLQRVDEERGEGNEHDGPRDGAGQARGAEWGRHAQPRAQEALECNDRR